MKLGFLLGLLLAGAALASEPVTFTQEPGKVQVIIGGKPFTTLFADPKQDKPYFHPLRTASGVVVTRGWPVDKSKPGETTDHPHHRGLWWAHGLTNGVDFWTTREGRTGRYNQTGPPKLDAAKGRITMELEMAPPAGPVIGSLTEEYIFSGDGQNRFVDIRVVVRADKGADLKLGDTKEGVMAFRVADDLTEEHGVVLSNSEGGVGEKQVWGKRARWVDYSGKVGGESVGMAMFDHPSNRNYPTFWMARGYGLGAANRFGEHEFTGDAGKDGSITIAQGEQLELRYRVFIHPGDAGSSKVAEQFSAYAKQ